MKQPHPMTESLFFGCVIGNGWCFISWNSKGITNKVPPSWSPSAEKLEKKSLFSAFCWNKTTICYDGAFFLSLSRGTMRFFSTFRFSAYCRQPYGWGVLLVVFWAFQKNGNHLLWQCLSLCMKRLCHICDCFISTARWKYSLFLQLSPWRNPRLRHFVGTPLELQGKSISHFLWQSLF